MLVEDSWEFAKKVQKLSPKQKDEYNFRRENFGRMELPEESLDFVQRWIK